MHQFDECLYAKHKRNRGKVILSLFIISTTVVEAMMSHVKYIWDNSQQVSNSMSELLIFSRQKDEDAIASLKKHSTSKSQNICDQCPNKYLILKEKHIIYFPPMTYVLKLPYPKFSRQLMRFQKRACKNIVF